MSTETSGASVSEQAHDAATGLRREARQAAHSRWLERGARIGMVSRSVLYLVLAWLAVQIAIGRRSQEADQNGALRTLAHGTVGRILLVLLASAFAIYALWRLTVVFFGDAGERDWRTRLEGVIGFLAYGLLCVTAISLTLGAGNTSGGSARQATSTTARIMRQSWGRTAVIIAGVVVVIVGAVLVVDGFRRSFEKTLQTQKMSPRTKRCVDAVGVVGNVARGVVTILVGALLIDAGWTFRPKKSAGIDGALQTLAHATAGPWVLGAVALGLMAFATFSFAEARYRRT
jgi:hypothetical protein